MQGTKKVPMLPCTPEREEKLVSFKTEIKQEADFKTNIIANNNSAGPKSLEIQLKTQAPQSRFQKNRCSPSKNDPINLKNNNTREKRVIKQRNTGNKCVFIRRRQRRRTRRCLYSSRARMKKRRRRTRRRARERWREKDFDRRVSNDL